MERVARLFFGFTALCVLVGISLSVVWALNTEPATYVFGADHVSAEYHNMFLRVLNLFTYFTIMSNIIVCVTCALLAKDPNRNSDRFAMWRLAGLVAITITGLVYNLVLASLWNLTGLVDWWSNNLEHVIVPILTVVGWLVFGPRLPFRWKTIVGGAAVGLAWLAFTLIRGAFTVPGQPNNHWYPYPFLDVEVNGYATVLVNSFAILVMYVLFAMAILGLDKVLPGRTTKATEADQVSA